MNAHCSPLGFDLSTWEGQVANIKAVKQRIASGRYMVKGGTAPPLPLLVQALDTQNQGESAPVLDQETPEAPAGSMAVARLIEFIDLSIPQKPKPPRPFDFASFRTEAIAGEADPLRIPFSAIVRLVCRECGIAPSELWSPYRGPKICFARAATWWLARQWTGLSLPRIGKMSVAKSYAGAIGKDHSTVVAAVRRFEGWREGTGSYHHVPSYQEWMARRGS